MLRSLGLLTAVLVTTAPVFAAGPPAAPCSEQICYQDCISHRCQLVPETKQIKKTVYEVHEVPFCLKKLPPLCSLLFHRGCECDNCAECDCVRYKRVLVKKEIVCEEYCVMKCVPEEICERVPCRVCPPTCQQP